MGTIYSIITPSEGGSVFPATPETQNKANQIIKTYNANTQHTGRVYAGTEGANSENCESTEVEHTFNNQSVA